MSGIDDLSSATLAMRLAFWRPRIVLATTIPDTAAVVISSKDYSTRLLHALYNLTNRNLRALRVSVARAIREDMSKDGEDRTVTASRL